MSKNIHMEAALKQIVNQLPDGIVWVEDVVSEAHGDAQVLDYRVRFINESACRLLGLSIKDWSGSYLFSDHVIIDPVVKEVLQLEHPVSQEYYISRLGRWLFIEKQCITDGNFLRLADITYIKEQQQRIETLAHKLQQAINTSQAGTFYTSPIRDENGVIVDWVFNTANQTIASLVNLKPEELIGQPGSKWFPAYITNGLFDIYVEVFTTGKSVRFDYHYYEENKLDVWFDFMVTKFEDELLITLTDFTTIKKLQLQLEEYVYELKRSNESLGQFAYAASHDLQEPLRKINIYVDRLEREYADVLNDDAYGYVERIKTVARRMRRLIQDLLIFAEVGSTQIAQEPVNLTQVVREVMHDLEVAIEERGGRVEFTELGQIKGDSVHMQQLFQNLISNALKYSKPDVPPLITLASREVSGEAIEIPEARAHNQTYLLVTVQDNGQGFSDEQALQIFKIFQRLPQHRLEHTGTGIGLAIVKRVVENHKGYISARGIPGEGATFFIYLPIH